MNTLYFRIKTQNRNVQRAAEENEKKFERVINNVMKASK